MPSVRIPNSRASRNGLTYARLLLRVLPRGTMATAFEGQLFKPGALIDEAALWPTDEYPRIPILLEYAGSDHSGRGHHRSKDIYLLWRYDGARGQWIELVRCHSERAEWIEHLRPVALEVLGRVPVLVDGEVAARISARVVGVLDQELERLTCNERHVVMAFVYQAFSARAVAY